MSYDFFAATLPEQGRFCIATLLANGSFSHDWFTDKLEAYNWAIKLSHTQPKNIYYALGGYDDSGFRKQPNCLAMRSYALDIDCGEDKPYATQRDGATALLKFCQTTHLPVPTLVNSGRGLYAYWVMDADVDPMTWKAYGQMLKDLCVKHGFKIDPKIAANQAQVLRPVGTLHKKNISSPLPVTLGTVQPLLSQTTMAALLTAAMGASKLDIKAVGAPKTEGLNDEFKITQKPTEKPSAYKMANRCHQLAIMRDSRGNIPQPHWYACVGLLTATVEAPEIIHKWSEGHPNYSVGETDKKIEQASRYNASTCELLHESNPGGCDGCAFHSKINSPWRLGLPDPAPITPATDDSGEDTLVDVLPYGITRTDKGIIHTDSDGVVTVIYPYDMIPVSLCHDRLLAQDILRLKVKLPQKGWTDVYVRCAHTEDKKALAMSMIDAGLYIPTGKDERGWFFMVIRGYMDKLMDMQKRVELPPQMGWVDHGDRKAFVLGDRLITENGVETVGVAPSISSMVGRTFAKQGDLATWTDATRALAAPRLEPWAFALAALGFGAPLMKFTGYTGALVSMVGPTGRGKTAMAWWAMSVWGNPHNMQLLQRDTHNATMARMSVYNNLPLYIDEITNIKADELSNLAYGITQGRDKLSLNRDRKERDMMEWATIGGTSTNKSLIDALTNLKASASAEINRIFEYEFPAGVAFNGVEAYEMMMDNYGLAGEVYAKYLVDHQDEHSANLRKIQVALAKEAGCAPEERYWVVINSCALYGAAIAKKLGLFHADLSRLRSWIVVQLQGMRSLQASEAVGAAEWIGGFLNKYTANTITISRTTVEHGQPLAYLADPHQLRGALLIRTEIETGRVYIDQRHINKELGDACLNRAEFKRELTQKGILVATGQKMTLGKGVASQPSVQTYVWVLQLDIPEVVQRPHLTVVKKEVVNE